MFEDALCTFINNTPSIARDTMQKPNVKTLRDKLRTVMRTRPAETAEMKDRRSM